MSKPKPKRDAIHKVLALVAEAHENIRSPNPVKVMEKAMKLKAAKNAIGSSFIPSHSLFRLLYRALDAHFIQIAKDALVVFRREKGSLAEQISSIRAQELVQAALAEALLIESWLRLVLNVLKLRLLLW
jgi:hypothetical protein